MKIGKKDYTYIHLNEEDRFAVSIGWSVQSFMKAIPDSYVNLLLLKHTLEEVEEYNANTRLNFVEIENIERYVDKNAKDLVSWIDFEDREDLNELTKDEVAELLYLSHMLEHIRSPFNPKLKNKLVYLSENNSSYTKVYFRKWQYFAEIIGKFISSSMEDLRLEKSFFGFPKKSRFEKVPISILTELFPLFEEGMLFSLSEVEESRFSYNIPIWVVGDFHYEDELFEGSQKVIKGKPKAVLSLIKKTKGWNVNLF